MFVYILIKYINYRKNYLGNSNQYILKYKTKINISKKKNFKKLLEKSKTKVKKISRKKIIIKIKV